MPRYATGTHSRAICDRCGFEVAYLSLQEEWTGFKVCGSCWEPKHAQLEPRAATDAQQLIKPRPGSNKREDARVRIVHGGSTIGLTSPILQMESGVGLTPSGLASVTSVGDAVGVASLVETGVQSTTAVGTVNVFLGVLLDVTGIQSTTAVGTVSISAGVTLTETGVQITSSLGNEIPQAARIETGIQSTTALGTVGIEIDTAWSEGLWGENTWGD